MYIESITKLFQIVERPQHMLMRVSVGIHGEDIDAAIETYNLMSDRYFTHATPTLFNSGTRKYFVFKQLQNTTLGRNSPHVFYL